VANLGAVDADVTVIGAGIAGLAAADYLTTNGRSVTIIEGRERVGGRILTDFVHGRHPLLLSAAENAGLSFSAVRGQSYRLRNGRLSRYEESAGFHNVLTSPDLFQNDIPFSAFIGNAWVSEEQRADVTSYVEGFNGAFADRIGTRSLYHQQQAEGQIEGDSSSRLDSGYQSLVDSYEKRLRRSARLMLGAVVRNIEWRRGSVSITAVASDRPLYFSSKAAIITVPIGVLLGRSPSASIAFSPEPEMLRKLSLLDPGWAMRLNLVFSEPVWESVAPNAGFLFSDQQRFPVWWTRAAGGGYLLTGWNGGPKAAALAGVSKDELVRTALQTLSVLMSRKKTDLIAKLESVHYHNWHTDPFSAGSYSYVTAGGFEFSQTVGQAVEDTLWFAGEAMASEGYWGTVHGALASGRRAAVGIVALR
jgi:monoamine oxidase